MQKYTGGEILKIICEKKGITLSALATKMEIDRAQLYNITALGSRRGISKNMASKIRKEYPDIRLEFLLGESELMTQDDIDQAFSAAWELSENEGKEISPILDALGYKIEPEYKDIPVPSKSRDALGTDVLENTLVSYAFLHDGVKVASGCKETEITALQNDILDFARLWIERFIQQKAGAGNASK